MDHRDLIRSLSAARRETLARRCDRRGLTWLSIHWGVMGALALGIVLEVPGWPLLVVLLAPAVISLFALLHESSHLTAFASGALNRVIARVCGTLLLLPPAWFRQFHFAHHRHTQDPEHDPELAARKPDTLGGYLLHVSGLPVWRWQLATLFRNALGRCRDPFVPAESAPAVAREARLMLALYLAVLVASVAGGSLLAVYLWLAPLLLGQPLLRLFLLPEHAGCPESGDMLRNTRTIAGSTPARLLAWNMPLHAEHHAFPGVPFHRLPDLHRLTRAHVAHQDAGYLAFHRRYLAALTAPVREALASLWSEWPTWLVLIACYAAWLSITAWHDALGLVWVVPAALLVTLHSSLTHEMVHGHPTRSDAVNEALVFTALGLFVPFRRFKAIHCEHHRTGRLTDPCEDPESWYLGEEQWQRAPAPLRWLLRVNGCLAGRMLLGPALSLWALWRGDLRRILAGDGEVRDAWLLHLAGLVPVIAWLESCGVNIALYVLAVAYPGASLLMIRTFIEHRATAVAPERTGVIEAGPFMSLLFLNNNLHWVHHDNPSLSWHRLPARWRAQREQVLAANGGYHYPGGYLQVARHWLLIPREPVVHPLAGRTLPPPEGPLPAPAQSGGD